MDFAVKWQQMMFAQTKEVNVAHNDHFVVFFVENRLVDQFCRVRARERKQFPPQPPSLSSARTSQIGLIALSQKQHCSCSTFGRFQQSFALHIFAELYTKTKLRP